MRMPQENLTRSEELMTDSTERERDTELDKAADEMFAKAKARFDTTPKSEPDPWNELLLQAFEHDG
jgi:hypothetical protein